MNIRHGFSGPYGSAAQNRLAPAKDLDLLHIGRVLWRGRATIVALGMVGLLLGAIYSFGIARPKYAATALLVLQQPRDPIMDRNSDIQALSSDLSDMNTELHIIRSRGLVRGLVEQLDLTRDAEFNPALRSGMGFLPNASNGPLAAADTDADERVLRNVQNAISARVQRNTRIFSISATSEDRNKAAQMANALAALYLQDQVETKFSAAEDAVTWLSDRVGVLQQELAAREEAVAAMSARMALTSVEGLAIANARLKDARARLNGLQRNAAMDQVKGQSNTTQQRLELQKAALQRSIIELESAVAAQGADLTQLQQLEREAQATRVLYETLLSRLKEASALGGLQQADARVLSAASVGTYQSLQKGLIMLLSMLAGMFAAGIYVLSKQFLHAGFRTADELEQATGKPVLGQIPVIPVEDRSELVPFLADHPTAAVVEAVRNLRTSLLMSNIDQPPQVILTASAMPGEGKTTQAVALAQNLAGLGKRVLLIEGDIRRRTLTQYVADAPERGIVSVLAGDLSLSDGAHHVPALGADVLLGEVTQTSAADIFASRRFEELMKEARAAYDMIVIDSPPVLVVPDARVIARHADAIIFMVAWDKTTRRQVGEGLRQFQMANCAVTGLVLSQVRPGEMARYGYGDANPVYAGFGDGYYGAT
ncbi:AAA family ATPase [Aliiroseovarius sp. S1339]|uniref:AAA family ATPase n=1 Tax=Aliiroseovarius sp. S1339 TaxID=2936990 RepID=UPI0020BD557F|nr:AAA family ATPase [Aliiroseovarius sp. S1339]MCK8463443.1 AAA family ATPase [Aliiroseovarius sp. S1339]